MTRDELVDDLAGVIRHETLVYDEADIARAVLARLEALGWRQVIEHDSTRDYRAEWESAARDALQWRELAEKARDDAEHLRSTIVAEYDSALRERRWAHCTALERFAASLYMSLFEAPLPLGGPGQGTHCAERAEQVLPPPADPRAKRRP